MRYWTSLLQLVSALVSLLSVQYYGLFRGSHPEKMDLQEWMGELFHFFLFRGKGPHFSTNKAEDINRKRKNKNFPCQCCLATLSTFPCSPAEFSLHVFIVMFYCYNWCIKQKIWRAHGAPVNSMLFIWFSIFSFRKTSLFFVLFIPDWDNMKVSRHSPWWCI